MFSGCILATAMTQPAADEGWSRVSGEGYQLKNVYRAIKSCNGSDIVVTFLIIKVIRPFPTSKASSGPVNPCRFRCTMPLGYEYCNINNLGG